MDLNVTHDSFPAGLRPLVDGSLPELSDHEADAVYALAASRYEADDHASAADLFRLLVLRRARDVRSWMSLAMCHDAVHDYERACALYEIAIVAPRGDAERPRARLYLARALFAVGRPRDAYDALDEIDLEGLDDDLLSLHRDLVAALAEGRAR